MKTLTDKGHNKANKSVANVQTKQPDPVESAFQFVDNRPAAVQLRKMQDMANEGAPKYKRDRTAFRLADNGAETLAQRKLQKRSPGVSMPNPSSAVIQTYPPIEIVEGQQWVNEETDFQPVHIEEAAAYNAYIEWAKLHLEEKGVAANLKDAKSKLGIFEIDEQEQQQARVELQKDVKPKEPMTFFQMTVAGQPILLIGTEHGISGEDLSGKVPDEVLANAVVILEYPPLLMADHESYDEADIKGVQDKTQAALAQRGNDKKGTVVIGADGRKSYIDNKVQGVSLLHKKKNEYSLTGQLIDSGLIMNLAKVYMRGALMQKESTIGGFVVALGELVEFNATDFIAILAHTSGHLRALANEVKEGEKQEICSAVLVKLEADIEECVIHYKENVDKWDKDELIEYTNNKLLSALFDAVCNLLLFTLVLTNKNKQLVVAFGDDHIKPLKNLLDKVNGMRK